MTKGRRGKGEGGLHFDEHRKVWVGTIDLGRDGTGKRRRHSITARTKTEARQKLAELRREAENGPIAPARFTVGQLLDQWLDKGLPATVKSPNTVDTLTNTIEKHLKPRLGSKPLRQLTCDDVDAALADMIASDYAGGTVRRAHSTLTRAIRWGERRGKVNRNVSALCDTPAGPVKESRSLTVEQAKALLVAVSGERLEALVVTGLMVGLRPGELCGLPWDAVDLEAPSLTVRQSLIRTHGSQLSIGAPKTMGSLRTVALPSPVVAALRAHRQGQRHERMAAGSAWQETGLVFTTEVGTPIDPNNLLRTFDRYTCKAGLGHWHPHELRHSAASILAASGVPIQHIADTLGHATLRMTAETYRHKIVDVVSAAAAPMEATFSNR